MKEKEQMEIARNILNNAVNMNMSKEIILKISEMVDKYVLYYYLNENHLEKEKYKK